MVSVSQFWKVSLVLFTTVEYPFTAQSFAAVAGSLRTLPAAPTALFNSEELPNVNRVVAASVCGTRTSGSKTGRVPADT
jgi:hypothetical protein